MKESSAALKRLEESYGPAFDYDIKSKSYVKIIESIHYHLIMTKLRMKNL